MLRQSNLGQSRSGRWSPLTIPQPFTPIKLAPSSWESVNGTYVDSLSPWDYWVDGYNDDDGSLRLNYATAPIPGTYRLDYTISDIEGDPTPVVTVDISDDETTIQQRSWNGSWSLTATLTTSPTGKIFVDFQPGGFNWCGFNVHAELWRIA